MINSSKIDMADMVDMGEVYDDSPMKTVSQESEKKPHYPDIYGLNVTKLPAIKDAPVGSEVILVAKVKVKSLEVRENSKGEKKATATVDLMEACAYPMSEKKSNDKYAQEEDLPQKSSGSAVDMIMGGEDEEEDD